MDPREEELLTHLAAGTPIWAAWAALSPDEEKPPPKRKGCLWYIIAALLGLLAIACLSFCKSCISRPGAVSACSGCGK